MDFHELNEMTIAQLREVAADLEGLEGYTQMRKAQLLEAVCQHLNIALHEHHDIVGLDKGSIKQQIRALKAQRDEALSKHDGTELKQVRRRIHRLKRQLRRATV